MNDISMSKPLEQLSPAERMYKQHIIHVSNYQRRNKDKIKDKHKRYIEKMRNEPARYEAYLEKRRLYYSSVIKPKKLQKINT